MINALLISVWSTLAVHNFWLNMIVDTGNILNFNVGAAVDLSVPRSFWSRLSGKYGNMFYWQEKVGDTHTTTVLIATSCFLKQYLKRTVKFAEQKP